MVGRHIPNGSALRKKKCSRFGRIVNTSGFIFHNDAPAQRALGITVDNGEAFLGGSNDGIKRKIFIAFDSSTRGRNPCLAKVSLAGGGRRLTGTQTVPLPLLGG